MPRQTQTKRNDTVKLLPNLHAQLITQAIQAAQAADALPDFDIPKVVVTPPKNPDLADYASPVAMQLAKVARRKPLDIAEAIVAHLPAAEFVANAEVAPPGFINFRLNPDWLKAQVDAIIAEGDALFTLDIGVGKRAQVEFVSANPSGPITIGRTRGGVIGDTMARLLEAAGYAVEREYYFNNAGQQMIHLGNSLKLRYLQALGRDVTLPADDDTNFYRGEYLIDFAQALVDEQGDALVDADWEPFKDYAEQQMFDWIKQSLASIGIVHDVFFNENSLYESEAIWEVLRLLGDNGYVYSATEWEGASDEEKAKAATREPAQYFRSSSLGDTKDRVVVKGDGSPTYTLPDIAYHRDKINRGFDVMVNVLGSDHYTQHQVVKYGIQALGMNPDGIHVILHQMVHNIRGGQKLKMSTRRGTYETLDDLVKQTSADFVRYTILARSPNSDMDFDLDIAVKQSNENPVYYIQNAHVRCAGILREAAARNFSAEPYDLSLLGEDELRFLRKALELGEVIEQSVENYEPQKIAFYAQDLAAVFHPIYDRVRVLHTEVPEDVARARLRFYQAAQVVFHRVLSLMGMSAPERM